MPRADAEQTYFVPSVDTAARVLGMLSRYRTRASTLSEITTALQVSKTTCLRVLKTLQSHGLVQYDEAGRRYSLGYYCVVLGSRAQESLDYLNYLRPLMQECTRRTGLTSALVQRVSEDRMMYVAKEDSEDITHVNVSVGNRFPITDVSYGKWVLAFADEEERGRLLAPGLRRLTPRTRTGVAAYRAELDRIVHDGVLVSRSEYVPGVVAVSFPVRESSGDLLAVMTVLGLSDAVSQRRLKEVCAVMRDVGTRAQFVGVTS